MKNNGKRNINIVAVDNNIDAEHCENDSDADHSDNDSDEESLVDGPRQHRRGRQEQETLQM